MKKLTRIIIIGSLVTLLVTSLASAAIPFRNITVQSNEEETGDIPKITINRQYIIAQVSGEIVISEICNFTKLIFDRYMNIEMNGTVINSTLLDPFSIWPPISWIPGLRMIILPDSSSIHITINWFKGKLFTRNNGTSYRLMGMGLFVKATATIDLSENIHSRQFFRYRNPKNPLFS